MVPDKLCYKDKDKDFIFFVNDQDMKSQAKQKKTTVNALQQHLVAMTRCQRKTIKVTKVS